MAASRPSQEKCRTTQDYRESNPHGYTQTSQGSKGISQDYRETPQDSKETLQGNNQTVTGYNCEFVEDVEEYLLCKSCNLVARLAHITSCCGESFCQSCIATVLKLKKPCPSCQTIKFTTLGHVKNQKIISRLKVYCSLRAKGCGWSGALLELGSHLDPDLENCQYVCVPCPLHCQMHVARNALKDHVAKECTKRKYVCQYCAYEGTYGDVVGVHVPQCKYVPLQCPNRCGVTFERELLEDHMAMCRLEEVSCKFSGVGCEEKFSREDEDAHCQESIQSHLTLTASMTLKLQRKLTETEEQHKKEKRALEEKLEEQEKVNSILLNQVCALKDREKELEKKVESLGELLDANLQHLTQKMVGLIKNKSLQSVVKAMELTSMVGLNRTFEIKDFTAEKSRDGEYKSPAMYTHVFGHKFCVGVLPNGRGSACGRAVSVDVWSLPGEFDDQLRWPARAKFTMELVNQYGGKNLRYTSDEISWARPYKKFEYVMALGGVMIRSGVGGTEVVSQAFLSHCDVGDYLAKDCLQFCVSKIKCH